jgi:YhcH/YjgK/YiaL family protein
MILDHIDNAERYYSMYPGFKAAFEWLREHAGVKLPAGRVEIEGDRLYASVVTENGRGMSKARFETHRRYIDIQFMAHGSDVMGWRHFVEGEMKGKGYSEEKDLEFFEEVPEVWVTVPEGHFVIFFPEDAHAPMAGEGAMNKLVGKVRV